MKTLAFIPARGGSKRLPGKNSKLFAGKPLISYSIAFARYCGMDKIIVSTDDREIASIASSSDAEVVMRPAELSGDTATTSIAAKHCMETCIREGYHPDLFVTLQPTNPLRPQSLFADALHAFNEAPCDSVISVSLNKHKLGTVDGNNCFQPQTYQPGTRSQDLNRLYYENGLIYLSKPENVLQDKLFGDAMRTITTDELYATADIDTLFDFELAEFIYHNNQHLFTYLNIV
jgi:N-acylneuraminate cytidylyltransferase